MNFGEPTFCPKCGKENIIKKGKGYASIRKGTWSQKYECKECGRIFYGKTKHISEPMSFEYQSKPIPPIDWKPYNEGQLNETEMVGELLKELLDLVEIKSIQKTGRPQTSIKDILFCMVLKVYFGKSAGLINSTLRTYQKLGYIQKVPSKATLMNYFNDKRLLKLLPKLIELSALPISRFEEIQEVSFAVDSSGFSTSKFGRWFDHKYDKEIEKREYRKGHIMIGTKTNIVTSVIATDQFGADSPQLKYLVKQTKINFSVKEVSADKAYSSKENLQIIDDIGAMGLIPFKSNAKPKRNVGHIWNRMYAYCQNKPEDFFTKYHKRSNVETAFFMIKQKFGGSLWTKNILANFVEIYCKILCHNLCCLNTAYHKFDLKSTFWTQALKTAKIEYLA